MFVIEDGREHFYQWDSYRKLIVKDSTIEYVHFCNKTADCSLVVPTYQYNGLTMVDVPNILLQSNFKIRVYAYTGDYTKYESCFKVIARTKPDDYVYTETELHNFEELEDRISTLEDVAFNGLDLKDYAKLEDLENYTKTDDLLQSLMGLEEQIYSNTESIIEVTADITANKYMTEHLKKPNPHQIYASDIGAAVEDPLFVELMEFDDGSTEVNFMLEDVFYAFTHNRNVYLIRGDNYYPCIHARDGLAKFNVFHINGSGNTVYTHYTLKDVNGVVEVTKNVSTAAPDGFGLGNKGSEIDNFDNAVKAGFYAAPATGAKSGYPTEYADMKFGVLLVENRLDSNIYQTLTRNQYSAKRYKSSSGWQPWEWINPPYAPDTVYRTIKRHTGYVVYERVNSGSGILQYSIDYDATNATGTWKDYNTMHNAAPAGYGLGEKRPPLKNWNTSLNNGFNYGNTNSPDGSTWWGLTTKFQDNTGAQIAFKYADNILTEARRYYNYSGTFGSWEYVNPPMADGVEYRTTERFMGKPVYTMLINLGEREDLINADETLDFGELITDVSDIVDLHYREINGGSVYVNQRNYDALVLDDNFIYSLYGLNEASVESATLTVKYTKTK